MLGDMSTINCQINENNGGNFMSAFLEEYGKIIVVIIVVAALIALAILFKTSGSQNATSSFDAFMNTANQAVEEAQNGVTTTT